MSFSINPRKDPDGFYYLYVVAEYDPPGNYLLEMKDNVLPPKTEETESIIITSLKNDKQLDESECINAFRNEALKINNILRRNHGTSSLKLNDDLNLLAQNISLGLANYDLDDIPLGVNIAQLIQSEPYRKSASDCQCIYLFPFLIFRYFN